MSIPATVYGEEPEAWDAEQADTKEKYDRLLRLLFEHAFKL